MIDIPTPDKGQPNSNPAVLEKLITNSQSKLERLLASQQKIAENKSKPITFSQPIVWQNENPVFFPKTINVIQGKAGVHKSRLAETIAAAMLRKIGCQRDLLNFRCDPIKRYAICYVDTERNLSEQLPYSLQQIQTKAGYTIQDEPYGFDFISLLEFEREERFEMLNMYLDYIREKFPVHLFIVLDVITDCVFNFNDTKDSMKLIDMMNQSINRYDVTFLCLIHENPGNTDKARGHLGTEILNKASTVIQIGYEKDAENSPTDLLRVSYLKCRSSRKHEPFYVQYSDAEKGLVVADLSSIQTALSAKTQKATLDEMLQWLGMFLKKPTSRKELIEKLSAEMDCKERTIEARLKSIVTHKFVISGANSSEMYLCKRTENREIFYFLSD